MECNDLPSDMPKYKRGNDTIALPFDLSESVKELVIKFPFFIPKKSMNINVWNGHVFSYFSIGGKTVYQIRVEGPNVLVEFQFDTDRYLFEDFDMVRYGTLDVEDDRIGECAFDLSAYHL